nr:ribonuclease H-like domain-containing protein [Tanacetum cinerariifolium]
MESLSPQVVSAAKLPILNLNEFDLWKMRIEQLARKNELKAQETLLMVLPDKHQLKFNIHKDAKSLMEAIEKTRIVDSVVQVIAPTHSVISVSLSKYNNVPPTLLNYTLSISTPMRSLVGSKSLNKVSVLVVLDLSKVVTAVKLPILNPNEFDLWKMRIEHYFLMTDYSLWEVILNADSPTPTRIVDSVVQVIAPTHSVISVSLSKYNNVPPTLLNYTLSISTPMRSLV